MTFQTAALDGVSEFSQSLDGFYRILDTTLVFVESSALETTKHVMKGFQIFPDTLNVYREYDKNGQLRRPFTAAAMMLRDLVVELEVACHLGLIRDVSMGSGGVDHRIVCDAASVMHSVCMALVGNRALKELGVISRLRLVTKGRRKIAYRKLLAYLAIATAITKIAQQVFLLSHIDNPAVYGTMTLVFNICAIASSIFRTPSMQSYFT